MDRAALTERFIAAFDDPPESLNGAAFVRWGADCTERARALEPMVDGEMAGLVAGALPIADNDPKRVTKAILKRLEQRRAEDPYTSALTDALCRKIVAARIQAVLAEMEQDGEIAREPNDLDRVRLIRRLPGDAGQ